MRDVEKTRWGKGWGKVRQGVSDTSRKWSSVLGCARVYAKVSDWPSIKRRARQTVLLTKMVGDIKILYCAKNTGFSVRPGSLTYLGNLIKISVNVNKKSCGYDN